MKRSIVPILIVLFVCLVAVGFYRGWFVLSSPEAQKESNKVNLNLTMDKGKIQEDAEAVKQKATEITDKVTK